MCFDSKGLWFEFSEKSELKWESYGYFSVWARISRWIGSISDPIRSIGPWINPLKVQNPTHTPIQIHFKKFFWKPPKKRRLENIFFITLFLQIPKSINILFREALGVFGCVWTPPTVTLQQQLLPLHLPHVLAIEDRPMLDFQAYFQAFFGFLFNFFLIPCCLFTIFLYFCRCSRGGDH